MKRNEFTFKTIATLGVTPELADAKLSVTDGANQFKRVAKHCLTIQCSVIPMPKCC